MEGNLNYKNPAEQSGRIGSCHKFTFEAEGGELISGADVEYLSKPIPHFYINSVFTDEIYQSQGHASKIMDQVEQFLITKNKPGLLIDKIDSKSPEVQGMYQRRGWVEVPGTNLLAYNLSEGIDTSILTGYQHRYTEYPIRNRLRNEKLESL